MSIKDTLQEISQLPQALQDALSSDSTTQIIKDALNLAGQDESKFDAINDLVAKVIKKESPVNRFLIDIKNIGFPVATAQIINSVIQQKIFAPIRQYLLVAKQLPTQPPAQPSTSAPIKEKHPEGSPLVIKKNSPTRSVGSSSPSIPRPQSTSTPKDISQQPLLKKEVISKPIKKSVSPIPLSPSIPEPSETTVGKPELKTTEIKNFAVSSTYQKQSEQIKNKLLEAMGKRAAPPSIVEAMKEVSQEMKSPKKQTKKDIKQTISKLQSPNSESSPNFIGPSQVVSGQESKNFTSPKNSKEKVASPFILDVKLKENKNKPEDIGFKKQKPIKYSKFRPQNPFGSA